jgi:hypothetical protein
MANSSTSVHASTCLGRTCLKWGADGELTALDHQLVMERLAQVDRDVAALAEHSLNCEATPSIS